MQRKLQNQDKTFKIALHCYLTLNIDLIHLESTKILIKKGLKSLLVSQASFFWITVYSIILIHI